MWTKERIAELLRRNDLAVEKAIVAIYNRQTQDEKSSEDTKHHTGVGFSGAHAKRGSYYARWILGNRHLTHGHLERARAIALRYTQQLAEIANYQSVPKVRDIRDHIVHRDPLPGTYAATARFLAESGIMTGEEADAWKDRMKDEKFDEPPPPEGEQ